MENTSLKALWDDAAENIYQETEEFNRLYGIYRRSLGKLETIDEQLMNEIGEAVQVMTERDNYECFVLGFKVAMDLIMMRISEF
ncbi:hypothetical protein Q5O24_00615 [Eubacteriaceae bacterium ES3]|nr:hypothetical protein Q5O24_00615 [Eubacteriaceae bacterium ES3]